MWLNIIKKWLGTFSNTMEWTARTITPFHWPGCTRSLSNFLLEMLMQKWKIHIAIFSFVPQKVNSSGFQSFKSTFTRIIVKPSEVYTARLHVINNDKKEVQFLLQMCWKLLQIWPTRFSIKLNAAPCSESTVQWTACIS